MADDDSKGFTELERGFFAAGDAEDGRAGDSAAGPGMGVDPNQRRTLWQLRIEIIKVRLRVAVS